MKQVLQDIRTGATRVEDVPRPAAGRGQLLIRTCSSLVSAGTERMLVEFGKAGWIEKARQQPDKVRAVLDKAKTDGWAPTIEAVLRKLEEPIATGYCNVGEVAEVGEGVAGFAVGDRVASSGKHAEYVAVPVNLCARVPAGVDDDSAAFTVIGAVALQGIRLAAPTLGEAVVVTGLGLVGLLAVQLLRAQGCRVLAIDFDRAKLDLARRFGADGVDLSAGEDPVAAARHFSRGSGVDAVIIAAATRSSEPVHQAALMCRKRGRIVLVGVTGLELSRADFYEKELTFQVSCSYGPGRHDPEYEEKGRDYPPGLVRWTEQRNFQAVLDMMADGRIDGRSLVSHRFPVANAADAYALVASDSPSLGILLDYRPPGAIVDGGNPRIIRVCAPGEQARATLGFIGAGHHASAMLVPAFRATGARLKAITSATGVSGTRVARKHGIELSSTDSEALLDDPEIDAVVIATRHASHASWVCKALRAGKPVFVEKPLALRSDEIDAIESAYHDAARNGPHPLLMVGFNRRFAPHVVRMRELLGTAPGPKSFVMTVNAGALPDSHWLTDPDEGGGRIIGEACHFVDLLRFLAAAPIAAQSARAMRVGAAGAETATLTFSFADGSLGTVHYFANGHKALAKERLEVFAAGRILQLDNFRRLLAHGWPGMRRMSLWRQDKGQHACAAAFVRAIESAGPSPIPFADVIEVARATLEANAALLASC